jgi:hypothetical protein
VPTLIDGSPTHVLIVHAVAVLLPLAVIAALVVVFVPSARRAFGLLTVAVTFVACVAVPLAFLSGSKLRGRVPQSSLIDEHVSRAHQLLPVAAVFGVAVAAYVLLDVVRRGQAGGLNRLESAVVGGRIALIPAGTTTSIRTACRLASVVVVILALATAVMVVRTGDSGAKAAWHGRLSATSH